MTCDTCRFKPYYNWITFNTAVTLLCADLNDDSFKPYYNWITFNTYERDGNTIPKGKF